MNLFAKYQKLLTAVFTIVTIISIVFLGLQWQSAYQHELKIFKDSFGESSVNLDGIVKSVTDHLHIIQETAEDYINTPSYQENQTYRQYLRSQMLTQDDQFLYRLIPDATQKEPTLISNLSGRGSFSQIESDPNFEKEISMSLTLNPIFKATIQNIPDITWAYYTSGRKFINIYPYDPEFEFEEALLETPFFINGMPENNPQHDLFWTPIYLDIAGQGLMVTLAAPVYEQQRFLGTVAVDFTLNILSHFIQSFSYPQGTLMISGDDHQLLAHPSLIIANDHEMKSLEMALPPELIDEIDSILQQPNNTVIYHKKFGIIHKYLEQAPWHLIGIVPQRNIYKTVFKNSLFASLIPLLGLGVCLIFMSSILKKAFVQPACQLTEHIEKEAQGAAQDINNNLPELWKPWFNTISTNFEDKRKLLQELEAQIDAIKSTQLQLVQSEKMSMLGSLVAGVAHEINNPAAFLMGNLQPAKNYVEDLLRLIELYQTKLPQPDPEIEEFIEEIDFNFVRDDLPKLLNSMTLGIERIRNISHSLRIFSRKDQERKSLFDIHMGLNSTLLILKHRTKATEKRPEIIISKCYGKLPQINCFAGQLNQVFINLLANAIDAFDIVNHDRSYAEIEADPNVIEIRTVALDEQNIQIEIRDNGSGIDVEIQQRIFEQGFTTKTVGKGTGLGLAIAHQIVTEKHNGTLTCLSQPGNGTVFTIRLPLS